ncbi:MAG: EamA family transporter [Bacteroidetes bacterium]|nr:EamA family transporter [Bacteroidota bacterium]
MSRKLLLAHLALLGANLIFGVNYVIAKGIMPDYLEPRAIILLRVIGATIIFWVVGVYYPKEKVEKKDLFKFGYLSVFGVAINQIMFFEGLNLTTPINASIIMVGVPTLVLVFSHFFIGDKLTQNKIIGIFIGFAGAAFLILQSGNFSFSSDTFVGNIFVLINASSYGLFIVLVKPLMAKYSPITIMKWVFLFGLVFVAPISLNLVITADYAAIPSNIWMSIGFVILFTTVFAYLLNNYSLKTISPTINSAYIYLQPVIASVVALSFGKDNLSVEEVIAATLIFIGVYFVSFKKKNLFG